MVTLRSRSGTRPEEPPPVAEGFIAEDHESVKPVSSIIRKSVRLQNAAGAARNKLRRSTRPTQPTRKYQATRMPDGLGPDRSRLTKRCLHTNKEEKQKLCSKAQRRRRSGRELSDSSEKNVGATQNPDATTSRTCCSLGPSSELLRGTFRISTSGLNVTHRGRFRPCEKSGSKPSDGDESDDEEQNGFRSCRTLGLTTDELLGTREDGMSSGAVLDLEPTAVDRSVGFDSIGGLSSHISALKEMLVFPLLYPEVFDNFKIHPPRGCLFYGPPGTGKTLVARALANECCHGNRKVAFFMRKGADCLSKWVGESERQLRFLFERAHQLRPSIIFFDEIDGLAPVRSSRQEQIHSSIVSTLLALMDGLDPRGEVVVIGATNRLDSVDPALRRPGRFDREFFFGLPDRESRREILRIHTWQWRPHPPEGFLEELAERCVGYCGADIRAVCTEAALCALRRRYPQIYSSPQKLLLDVASISITSVDFVTAMRKMSPASQRSVFPPAKPLLSVVAPLLGAALQDILDAVQRLFPHAEQGMKRKKEPDLTSGVICDGLMYEGNDGHGASSVSIPSKSKHFLHFARSAVRQPTSYRPRMLLAGRPGAGQTSHLAPAVLHALESFTAHSLVSAVLFGASVSSPEEACSQVFCEAKRTSPSILYVPHMEQWWETAGPALKVSFLSLLSSIPSFSPILLLATCSIPYEELDPEIQTLFREEYGEVYTVTVPTGQERTDFFQDLILNQAAEAPPSRTAVRPLEILPLAPLPPAHQLSDQEEDVLRKLCLFLRNIAKRLMMDRRFESFATPVDPEEAPDYLLLIKKPMDLSTLLTNIDEHKYVTVREFMADADLIWQNALQYNRSWDPADGHIRYQACALKDTIRCIIRDELDQDFERVCEEIREARVNRASFRGPEVNAEEAAGVGSSAFGRRGSRPRAVKKKPRKSKWSTGAIMKPKRRAFAKSASSSCSSMSSRATSDSLPEQNRGASSSSNPSCSTMSESSDGEQTQLSGHHCHVNVALVNGHQPQRSDRVPRWRLNLRTQRSMPQQQNAIVEPLGLSPLEKHNKHRLRPTVEQEPLVHTHTAAGILGDGTAALVVDRCRLKRLLSRAVEKTEGAEVEQLEKLYALLAQCIYRHRNADNKTELIQEMMKEIEDF